MRNEYFMHMACIIAYLDLEKMLRNNVRKKI